MGYDAYGYGSYGSYGYGGGYQALYEGPYFLDLSGQLSGPGSSAYERLHTVGNLYINTPTGLDQTGYAYEGRNGSVYQRATDFIGDIQPYGGGPRYYSPDRGSPVYSEYYTNTSYRLSSGSSTVYDVRTTSYTTDGFGFAGRGPVDHTYSTYSGVEDREGKAYTRNTYSTSATYYASGAVLRSDLNSYSQFYDGKTVAGSIFETGYRSYTDASGYTTTSYIDTRPGMS